MRSRTRWSMVRVGSQKGNLDVSGVEHARGMSDRTSDMLTAAYAKVKRATSTIVTLAAWAAERSRAIAVCVCDEEPGKPECHECHSAIRIAVSEDDVMSAGGRLVRKNRLSTNPTTNQSGTVPSLRRHSTDSCPFVSRLDRLDFLPPLHSPHSQLIALHEWTKGRSRRDKHGFRTSIFYVHEHRWGGLHVARSRSVQDRVPRLCRAHRPLVSQCGHGHPPARVICLIIIGSEIYNTSWSFSKQKEPIDNLFIVFLFIVVTLARLENPLAPKDLKVSSRSSVWERVEDSILAISSPDPHRSGA